MTYKKIVEMIPGEKRGKLSDKLLNYLLKTKKEGNLPASVATCFLEYWQTGEFEDEKGLALLLGATAMVELDKTTKFIEEDLGLADVAKAVKEAEA